MKEVSWWLIFFTFSSWVLSKFWAKLDPRLESDLTFIFSLIWAFRGYITPPFGPLAKKVVPKIYIFGLAFSKFLQAVKPFLQPVKPSLSNLSFSHKPRPSEELGQKKIIRGMCHTRRRPLSCPFLGIETCTYTLKYWWILMSVLLISDNTATRSDPVITSYCQLFPSYFRLNQWQWGTKKST